MQTFVFSLLFLIFTSTALAGPERITGTCARPLPFILSLDYSYCRALAWLDALKKASSALPNFADTRLWEMDYDPKLARMAIASLIFPVEKVTENADGDEFEVVLNRPEGMDAKTLAIFKDPELLPMTMILILETKSVATEIQDLWPLSLQDVWKCTERLQELSNTLDAIWDIFAWLRINSPVFFSIPSKILLSTTKANCSAIINLLLAPLQLDAGMYQSALNLAESAMKIEEKLENAYKQKYIWDVFKSHACYTRGLANWRQDQQALAEVDFKKALLLAQRAGLDILRGQIFTSIGELQRERQNWKGMCINFLNACATGNCKALIEARQHGYCDN